MIKVSGVRNSCAEIWIKLPFVPIHLLQDFVCFLQFDGSLLQMFRHFVNVSRQHADLISGTNAVRCSRSPSQWPGMF